MMNTFLRVAAVALTVLTSTRTAFPQAKLALAEREIDLGRIYNGQIVKATIPLKNAGSSALKIIRISTSCGCTTVRQPEGEIPPGKTDMLEVEFNSSGFRGRATKHVFIETNDQENQYVSVTLSAEIVEELAPVGNSSLVWFSDVPVGSAAQQRYVLKNISGRRLTIKGIRSPSKDIRASYDKKVVAPQDTLSLMFTVQPAKPGYVMETVYVETDSKNQSLVPVRVSLVGVSRP
ncbi:MAG: hypothetical protein HBSIN02_15110 [Bacteroidia bacterium]|nr:MAG: hypothetical protein HBSIN02_15110 [Bacteroidia bacterium]